MGSEMCIRDSVIVVRIRIRAELDLFDLNDLLLFAGLGLTLLRLIFELAKVHDLAHGRIGIGRNFNKVQPGLFGHLHGARGRDHAGVFTIGANQANFCGTDVFVYARARIPGGRRVMWSASDGGRPLVIDTISMLQGRRRNAVLQVGKLGEVKPIVLISP